MIIRARDMIMCYIQQVNSISKDEYNTVRTKMKNNSAMDLGSCKNEFIKHVGNHLEQCFQTFSRHHTFSLIFTQPTSTTRPI